MVHPKDVLFHVAFIPGRGGRALPYMYGLGGGVPLSSQKPYIPFTRLNFANFVTQYSSRVKMLITVLYFNLLSRAMLLNSLTLFSTNSLRLLNPIPGLPNGLKTIPFPASHTRVANIWEYSPPGLHNPTHFEKCVGFLLSTQEESI